MGKPNLSLAAFRLIGDALTQISVHFPMQKITGCVRKVLDSKMSRRENSTSGIVKPQKPDGFGGNSGCGGRTRIGHLLFLALHQFHKGLYSAVFVHIGMLLITAPTCAKGKQKGKYIAGNKCIFSPRTACRKAVSMAAAHEPKRHRGPTSLPLPLPTSTGLTGIISR